MIKIFADTSDLAEIGRLANDSLVGGFTTNPSLARAAGVSDYWKFATDLACLVGGKPFSVEVVADDFYDMERQAEMLGSLKNCYVKVPVTNSQGKSTIPLINKLSERGIKVNVTAVTGHWQTIGLLPTSPMIVSIFAGRIADTGRDPKQVFDDNFGRSDLIEFLWASPREVLNIYQAEEAGADIITLSPELIEKYYRFKDMDLDLLSLMTVQQFYKDARAAGLDL